jgi:hypothetical protein
MGGASGYCGEEIIGKGSTRQVSLDDQIEESLYDKRILPPTHQFAVNLTQKCWQKLICCFGITFAFGHIKTKWKSCAGILSTRVRPMGASSDRRCFKMRAVTSR